MVMWSSQFGTKFTVTPPPTTGLTSAALPCPFPVGVGHLGGGGEEHTQCGAGGLPAAAGGEGVGRGVRGSKVSVCRMGGFTPQGGLGAAGEAARRAAFIPAHVTWMTNVTVSQVRP